MPTVLLPVTVEPDAGLVKAAVSTGVGGVTMPFFTLTLMVEPPVLLDESFTVSEAVPTPPTGSVAVAVSVCVPLATLVVSQEKLGPVPVMAVPSAFRPYVYVVPKPTPLPPTAASVTVAVPVSVALAAGAVNVTVGLAGGAIVLLTVTASVALPLGPAESVT